MYLTFSLLTLTDSLFPVVVAAVLRLWLFVSVYFIVMFPTAFEVPVVIHCGAGGFVYTVLSAL